MSRFLLILLFIGCTMASLYAQIAGNALIGYWHNWHTAAAPYIELKDIDARYNVVNLSFAVPKSGSDYDMEFVPVQQSSNEIKNQINLLQSQGKKVIISIGGANATVSLDNVMEKEVFVSSMTAIINAYGFDGIDIDLEGSSVSVSGGTIAAPSDAKIKYLISAIKEVMGKHYQSQGKHLVLTVAPETAYVQGGMSSYGGVWGAYLPIIDALRDSIDILQVQLYNSGSMYGIDGKIYSQGNADFIVAMTDAVVQGFNTNGGYFKGLPASKIAVGLPACALAAGSGYVTPTVVKQAVNYLLGRGGRPGNYTLANSSAHPGLKGMMTWSINWDNATGCGTRYEYAKTYSELFNVDTYLAEHYKNNNTISCYPNPFSERLNLDLGGVNESSRLTITNSLGQICFDTAIIYHQAKIATSNWLPGTYTISYNGKATLVVKN